MARFDCRWGNDDIFVRVEVTTLPADGKKPMKILCLPAPTRPQRCGSTFECCAHDFIRDAAC